MRKFVLRVWYGTGTAAMITDTPSLVEALNRFLVEYKKTLPDTKMYGMPEIIKAEIIPCMYESVYEAGNVGTSTLSGKDGND